MDRSNNVHAKKQQKQNKAKENKAKTKTRKRLNDVKPFTFGQVNCRINKVSFEDVSFTWKNKDSSPDVKLEPAINNVSFDVSERKMISLIGRNGSGKSTLLKLLVGEVSPSSGSVVVSGKIGYFDQIANFPNTNLTSLQYLKDIFPEMKEQELRAKMSDMNLKPSTHLQQINLLSGGEKVKLKLLELILRGSSILVLDEPTNHLDMETIDELIKALKEFDGITFISTHNRNLIRACEELWLMDRGRLDILDISYEEYQQMMIKEFDEQGLFK
jgi:ATPase subunit of ABC transporter with duplicated ATPase domains